MDATAAMSLQQRDNETFVSACHNNNMMVINKLFARVDINYAAQESRETPLGAACSSAHLNVVKKLLSHPNILVNDLSRGYAPLFLACTSNHGRNQNGSKVFELLIARPETNVNITGILYRCFQNSYCEALIGLLLAHPNYVVQSVDLSVACMYGKADHVKRLLVMGAEVHDHHQHPIIDEYRQNPDIIHVWSDSIGYVFTMLVCYSDDFLSLKDNIATSHKSFFNICRQLPIELQTRIANLMFGSRRITVTSERVTRNAKLLLRAS